MPKNKREKVGIIEHRIVDASDLEAVVDQVSDSFFREGICLLC